MKDSDENSLPAKTCNEKSSTPEKQIADNSKKLYERTYTKFMNWRKKENISSLSEQVLLAYFQDMSTHKSPPTVWTEYSMIKSTLNTYENTDISKFKRLYTFLKQNSEGYKAKQSKTFTLSEINTFIEDADDDVYLVLKVAVIFGVVGACRRKELHNLQLQQVTDQDGTLLVSIHKTRTEIDRIFAITGNYYHIVKKYMALRPIDCRTGHFFVIYQNGKCINQNIGINTFGNMGKAVAKCLKLKNPELYTGQCFRRTSATILNEADGDNIGRKSKRIDAGINRSIQNKMVIEQDVQSPGPSKRPTKRNQNTKYSKSSKPQNSPTRNTERCRFCGEFNQHCVPACDVTYLSATTTLAFNHVTVHLDFRDDTLPSAVCPHCDIKLQQMYEFVKAVKDAQESLFNVGVKEIKDETNDVQEFESCLIKTEYEEEIGNDQEDGNDEDSKDGILNPLGETVFVKETQLHKRKTNTINDGKTKKAKVTKSKNEAKVVEKSENEVTKLIIEIKEEKIERVEPYCVDIKVEREDVEDTDANDDDAFNAEWFSDTGTASAEDTTKDLVFEVRSDAGGFSGKNS